MDLHFYFGIGWVGHSTDKDNSYILPVCFLCLYVGDGFGFIFNLIKYKNNSRRLLDYE